MSSKYILVDEEFQVEVLRKLNEVIELLGAKTNSKQLTKEEDLMDTADLRAYLKVCRRTLLKYRKDFGLPFKRFAGGKIYYSRQQVDEFLLKNNF